EWLLSSWGVTLERIQPVNLADGSEKQFVEDILAVMTSFTGKFHRLRRGKSQSVLSPLAPITSHSSMSVVQRANLTPMNRVSSKGLPNIMIWLTVTNVAN
ncbi:MAG: hypothetical protein ACFFDI_17280, partial [Promethearchaeota archaeon]